jgi:spore coat protein CotH
MTIVAPSLYLASTQAPRSAALPAEETVGRLHLQLDEAAITSLKASPDVEVGGRLSVSEPSRAPLPVAVRLKGQLGSKRSIDDKPALKIALQNGHRVFGFENLTLNNMVQDPTMLHEALGYRIYADAGVTVPETRYLQLTINGRPRGLYLLVETIDRQFLARRFGDASGILYEGAYGTDFRERHLNRFELDEGQDPGRAELKRLIHAANQPGDGVFYGPGARVDTASFVSMVAVQVLIADWDNYYHSNNYRIYWKPAARRWFFIPTGIDQAFSTTRRVTAFGGTGVLIAKCLRSERCTTDYVAAVRRVADRMPRLNLTKQMEQLAAAIEPAAAADAKKPYRADETRAARLAMRRLITSRPALIRAEIARREAARAKRAEPPASAGRNPSVR